MSADLELDRPNFFIDGSWCEPTSASSRTQLEAATEQNLGTYAVGTADDIDRAVRAARLALDSGPWGDTSGPERAEMLRSFADALKLRGDSTAQLLSREIGTIASLSRSANVDGSVAFLEMMAGVAQSHLFETRRPSARGSSIVQQNPVGVVAAVIGWNYPLLMAIGKIASALAAGCTVVLKPPLESALSSYALADAAVESGLPAGVLNIVVGDPEAGRALVAHPEVDMIAFTGSTPSGQGIAAVAAPMMKRLSLELGGKSAAIILPDANLDRFVATMDTAVFKNGGQTCTTNSRILVPRERREEVIDALVTYAQELRVGNPLDDTVTLGPMASKAHRERVNGYIDIGVKEGAKLVTGGTDRPAGTDRGWFVQPTVFADVDNRSRIAQEEVFGPVIAVIDYETVDDAIRLANDTIFGLGGSVFTEDEQYGLDLARRVHTGTFGVNYYSLDMGAPFGGVKGSGIGREYGPEGIDEYLEYKTIYAGPDRLR